MDGGLAVAGALCVAMALGHGAIGIVWVLPGIDRETLPATPFGSRSLTRAMLRVSWHVVTIFAAGAGVILLILAAGPEAGARTVVLRSFAVMWLAATAMSAVAARPMGRHLPRLPVPLLWVVVAALCWRAAG